MLGPLFRYELTRLARRGLQPSLRAAFAGLLLVVLFLSYLAAFPDVHPLRLLASLDEPLTTERASRFGERFVVAFLYAQAAVVVLVTPAVTAGALGEERQRGSLDLLLTTELSAWEIVAGKFAARLVFVAALLLTGLPVVTLVILFGGVDPGQLLAGYAIALATACSLGAFTLFVSLVNDTLGSAVLRAYVWGVGLTAFGFCCSCFKLPVYLSPVGATFVVLEGWPRMFGGPSPARVEVFVGGYALVHVSLAAWLLLVTVGRLRSAAPATEVSPGRVLAFVPKGEEWEAVWVAKPGPVVPPIDEVDPLGWKERYFGGKNPLAVSSELFAIVAVGLPLLFLVLIAALAGGEGRAVSAAVACLGVVGLAAAGLRVACSVVTERQRGTLDSLLMLPGDRSRILRAKGAAAAEFPKGLAVFAVILVVLGVLRRVVAYPALLGVPLVFGGWVLGTIGFGLWLSVRCATPSRAAAWFFAAAVPLSVLPPLVGSVVGRSSGDESAALVAAGLQGLSPVVGLWNATLPTTDRLQKHVSWDPAQGELFDFCGALLGAVAAGLAGLGFGRLAVRRFERKG